MLSYNVYQLGTRQSLILRQDERVAEIAPLPGFSRETLAEAREELLAYIKRGIPPTLPSVRWGLSCLDRPFLPVCIPLSALNHSHDGCATLKLKLGHLTVDEAVTHVRTYLGKFYLRLDCNRSWTLQQALHFASHFSPTDFEYLEEPTRDLVEFSKITQFPVAVDESFREGFPYLDIPTLKAVIIKPMLVGEIPQLPVPIVLSSSYESSIGILHIAQRASPHIAHGLDTFKDDLLSPPLRVENGHLVWK